MADKYPALVKVESYGKSSEGRDMKVMIISTGGARNKPKVWIDGGIHGGWEFSLKISKKKMKFGV